jgi:pyruvate kinase
VSHRSHRSFEERTRRVLHELELLRAELLAAETPLASQLAALPAETRAGARNLVHYVALRAIDLRSLQDDLTELGLSSLGRAEGNVLGAIDTVCRMLRRAGGQATAPVSSAYSLPHYTSLRKRAQALFGHTPPPAVMVTMPSTAADDPQFIRALLERGMHVMRINAAHAGLPAVMALLGHLRRAEQETERRCKVLVDLGGPKLRTLAMEPGPAVVRFKPEKDALGRVTDPATIMLRGVADGTSKGSLEIQSASGTHAGRNELLLPLPFVTALEIDEEITVVDTRGRRRIWRVMGRTPETVHCTCERSTYVAPTSRLRRASSEAHPREAQPIGIPPGDGFVSLREGELLELRGDSAPGRSAQRNGAGEISQMARVACGEPALVSALEPGQRVLFDDGKISCIVEETRDDTALLRIARVRGQVAKLRAEKGINVPDTQLPLPALSADDRAMLRAVHQVVDMVGLSFVRSPDDVEALYEELAQLGADPGVVLKIETRQGFEELPAILLSALSRPHVAVMIARGDLAVECGFERLAEVQEEILWLCEAAHVPVIWATQVLETLAKTGQPTRAEITDAAMSERAECVMLNKGPYVLQAVSVLHDILERMRGHQIKKRSTLRRLRSPRFTSAHEGPDLPRA